MQEQQNVHPNQNYRHHSSQIQKRSVELTDLIRQNITYQNDQTIKKTLMKQSMMKISLDKDFKNLFNQYNQNGNNEQELIDQQEEKIKQNFLQVPQEIKQICEWLQQSDQYAGMAYLPLNSYTKLFHVIHQKVQTVSIIVTQYPLYYLNKMQQLNRLSKLKWAFLNSALQQEEKVKILQMYELKKLKLLFISPSMLRNQPLSDFDTQLLVICDFQNYRSDTQFVTDIISRTKPGRVLGLYPTLLQNSMEQHQKNKFHYINKANPFDFNYIALKCSRQQKQKTIINYLNKNPYQIQKTLILINKKIEANQLVKKMNMDAKATTNIFDYVSPSDLAAFNLPELFNKVNKIKQQQKIIQALKKIKSTSEVLVSTYSDILKFQQFDLVVFFSFTDVKKFVQTCPNVKNKVLLFDQDDYHNFRNVLTSDYLNYTHLQKNIIKIIQKTQKKQLITKKRFYSDYVDDRMLNKYSLSKQIIQKDEQKILKINNFCKTNNLTSKNFMKIVDGLVQLGMIQINCRAIYQIQIQQQCISWFRKSFPQLTEIKRKVNILDSSSTLRTITRNLLQDIKNAGIRFKVIEQALQFKVLKNYQQINWLNVEQIVNKRLKRTVGIFDYSLDVLRECAYSSIELTRRQKVLQRKDIMLKFSLNNMKNINESFHKSNLLSSQIEEYLRCSQEGITDQHELVMLLQGVERLKVAKQKQSWIFGRYRKMKYQELIEAVNKIFKNKKIKI